MRLLELWIIGLNLAGVAFGETLTLPDDQRPEWLRRDGIIMAASWEPLMYRVRRDGAPGYEATPEQRAAYEREHSPEMIAEIKKFGANFVMMHLYKGFGRGVERDSMDDAARFAKLCHEAGLHVGVYMSSGTIGWELLYPEVPSAKQWPILDADGKPVVYCDKPYRYYWDRNNPEAAAYHRKVVDFAIQKVHADLLHFDNVFKGPGREANSVARFRRYLVEHFSRDRLRESGVADPATVEPPMQGKSDTLLWRAWQEFCCESLADSYHDVSRYARSLRKDILVECNPLAVMATIQPPVDHSRLYSGGEACWHECEPWPGLRDGVLHTRIRTYKLARRLNNIVFAYTTTPLELAEAMAFNRDSLGCVCYFEYGKIGTDPVRTEPPRKENQPFIRFFRNRRELMRDADVVADVAVLRSFPSQVFGKASCGQMTNRVEKLLIEHRVPFQIIHDGQLGDLSRYRVLVLASCVAMSDADVEAVRRYVAGGGRLCVIGPSVRWNEWMAPRRDDPLAGLPDGRVRHITEHDDVLGALRDGCGGAFSLETSIKTVGVCAELTKLPDARVVHLVNYDTAAPVSDVVVRLRLPNGRKLDGVTLASPDRKDDLVLAANQVDNTVTFTVPAIRTYEVARVAFH